MLFNRLNGKSRLRIDYDPKNHRGIIHSATHLVSSLASSKRRIPVSTIPTPRQFIEMIIAWFYPDKYEEKLLNANGDYKDRSRINRINQFTFHDIENRNHEIAYIEIPRFN
jgi:hypothetical protein